MADLPLIVLGAGGHGRVVAGAMLQAGRRVLGFVDADPALWGAVQLGLPVLGDDASLRQFPPGTVRLVNGIGSVRLPQLRRAVFEKQKAEGYGFESVVHPRAFVADGVRLGEGVQVLAAAVVQLGSTLGDNVVVNTGAIVDHDCAIGPHTHVAPGATLSGGVSIGRHCHIGTGAVLIQNVALGDDSVVAAGAVVVRDHGASSRLAGVPAKIMRAS